jgi:hypothetical protein
MRRGGRGVDGPDDARDHAATEATDRGDTMQMNDLYVREQTLRLERESPPRSEALRRRWRAELAAERRALIGWLGDRLVAAGERLRAWAVAGALPQMTPPHRGRV